MYKQLIPLSILSLCLLGAPSMAQDSPKPLVTSGVPARVHVSITGSKLLPDPVEAKIRELEQAKQLRVLAVRESFPPQYELEGTAAAIAAVQAVAKAAKPDHRVASRKLKAAEALWKRKQPVHYAYQLQRSCFCPPEYTQPIAIRVFKGKIQQVTLQSGQPLPADRKAEAKTINQLFGIIRDAIKREAASVEVKYDAQYGFPSSISIDLEKMMADEEVYYSVSGFQVASGLKPQQ